MIPVPSWKLIAEVYDPAAAQNALRDAVAQYNAQALKPGEKPLASSQESFEGRVYYTIAVPDAGPIMEFHYTFADGYLIAGPSRAVIVRAMQIKQSGNTLLRSSKVMALMPRDRYTNFSLVFYQNIAASPLADLLQSFAPAVGRGAGAEGGRGGKVGSALASLKPSLIAAYAEPERITFAANGDLLGPALANLMRGDLMGAAGSALPMMGSNGTRRR